MSSRSVLVVTGEVSGDMHAGAAIEELRRAAPEVEVFGIGGDALAAAGVELIHHIREMTVFGPFAAMARYPHFRRVFRELAGLLDSRRPDLVLLVDFGGFNLRFAAEVKSRGIPVLYYVSPQVWASRRGRVQTMAEVADRLMVIFPFEPEVYAGTGLRVDYVGHPLVDAAAAARRAPPPVLPWRGEPRIALLPGSRAQEVDRIMPVLVETARQLEQSHPGCSFLFAAPNRDIADRIRPFLGAPAPAPVRWDIVTGDTRQVLRQARAAVVTSGTATLEAALMRCPMVVVYKTSAALYWLARRIVQVPHIGMVNLVAGQEICPERIQQAARAESVAAALLPLLVDSPKREAMLAGLDRVIADWGEGGAARRVAAILLETLGLPSPTTMS
jgi:lipid-A-disaccharide synthase